MTYARKTKEDDNGKRVGRVKVQCCEGCCKGRESRDALGVKVQCFVRLLRGAGHVTRRDALEVNVQCSEGGRAAFGVKV